MTKRSPFHYFKTSPEIIHLAMMLYVRFPLSFRNVEGLLHEHGIEIIVTDKLRSYGATMKVIDDAGRQKSGSWVINRAENSHLPFRRRERAMLRFRQTRSLQKLAIVHSSICNHFGQEREFPGRNNFKLARTAALSECHLACSA